MILQRSAHICCQTVGASAGRSAPFMQQRESQKCGGKLTVAASITPLENNLFKNNIATTDHSFVGQTKIQPVCRLNVNKQQEEEMFVEHHR